MVRRNQRLLRFPARELALRALPADDRLSRFVGSRQVLIPHAASVNTRALSPRSSFPAPEEISTAAKLSRLTEIQVKENLPLTCSLDGMVQRTGRLSLI